MGVTVAVAVAVEEVFKCSELGFTRTNFVFFLFLASKEQQNIRGHKLSV